MLRERIYMRTPGPEYKEPDTDWTDDPAPEWPEILRLMRHRLYHSARVLDMEDPSIYFSLVESALRLSALDEKHGVVAQQ